MCQQETRLLKPKVIINHETRLPNEAGSQGAVIVDFECPPRDAAGPGNRLLLNFDDVPPYYLGCLVTLGRKVRPGLRLVECHCVVQAVPFYDGRTLGSGPPLYLNNLSARGA